MTMLARAAIRLSALLLCASPAVAQHAAISLAPAGYAPEYAPVTLAALSVPQDGTVTATTATATSGTATIAAGVATIGPLAPQLGRDIRVVLSGTWAGTFAVGTSVDGCATINPLTIGGATWGSYTANANEAVDTPLLAGVGYCATATVTSGTLAYRVRQ